MTAAVASASEQDVAIPRKELVGISHGPILFDPVLYILAAAVADLERDRIANQNRLRALTRTEPDVDGVQRGAGLDDRHPAVRSVASIVDVLGEAEHQAVIALQRQVRTHPLGPWAKARTGIGDKQFARLLAVIGDPYWNTLHDRPRTVSELWAYCGLHVVPTQDGLAAQMKAGRDVGPLLGQAVPGTHSHFAEQHGGVDAPTAQATGVGVAATRRRGQRANWSNEARTRAYVIAESCIRHRDSPYRTDYDTGRAKYADAVHAAPCARCGPAGSPAAVGSPLNLGHQHARAIRLVMKAILRDLWTAARDAHMVDRTCVLSSPSCSPSITQEVD